MSYLVRKIERSRWHGSDIEGGRIKADVVANCIRPHSSDLSVWFAESEAEIESAKLAMLAAMNKLATVDLVVLTLDEVNGAGLGVVKTLSSVGPEILKPLHRDIHDLDLDGLKLIAQIIQRHIIDEKTVRITRAACKSMLGVAIQKGIFESSDLHEDLAGKL